VSFYNSLGAFAARFRLPLVLGWLLMAVGIGVFAPRITDYTTSDLSTFLPADAPFREANALYAQTFPNDNTANGFLVVVDGADGIFASDAADFAAQTDTTAARWIADFKTWLEASELAPAVAQIITPLDSPLLAQQLVAQNNRVALVNVALGDFEQGEALYNALETYLEEHATEGVNTYITGAIAISQSTAQSGQETADSTLWVTVALVIVLLLAIYRSPVSPLLPLFAVTLAYIVSQGIVGVLGSLGMPVSTYANVLLVVILFGAGTDYCLFLISRFREEMADTPDPKTATTSTIAQVGETLVSSAGTIFVGFMAMSFAEMGLFNTSGPVLAIGIVIMLLVGVTFVPALLALLGARAFWPAKAMHRETGRFYGAISQFVSSRPVLSVLVIIAIMLPLAIYGVTSRLNYDLLADLPESSGSVIGYNLVRENFGAGTIAPLNIVVRRRDADAVAEEMNALHTRLLALPTVGDVRSLDDPLGQNAPFRDLTQVSGQLRLIAENLPGTGDTGASGLSFNPATLLATLNGFSDYLALIAERFPEVADDENLATLQGLFANPLRLAAEQDSLGTALEGLAARFDGLPDATLMPSALAPLLAAGDHSQAGLLDQLNAQYLAEEGTAYRLSVILNVSPNSVEALDTVDQIRAILAETGGQDVAAVSGQPAVIADIRETMSRDFLRTMGFVICGIFIVLLLMLRSVIAPIYLILTVVITYAFTLGLTDVVFRALFGVESLSWYMPFFTFIFLVALGVDYSIFLIGRVKEEVHNYGTREGVHHAVAATGAIISSAGIILAGTFGALMSGSIMGLIQLGFAVAFGVLVDTFVVRTMLVPAITVLLGRWAWWPGALSRRYAQSEPPQAVKVGV
jgi:putative drug exporter of the RND superfamily